MFDRKGFADYVGEKSGNSYASGLGRIEKLYAVDIDAEYAKDQCEALAAQIESDKQRTDLEPKELKKRSDAASHLKRYIIFRRNALDTVADRIRFVIDHYKANFGEVNKEERYKWEALGWYKQHWKINAEDFSGMLANAFGKASNLLSSDRYYPYRMITEYAQADPEEVRRIFQVLHDENLPLAERYQVFRDSCKSRIDQIMKEQPDREKALNHYQDLRAVMVYLTFEYPEKYYLFKATMYSDFRDRIGFREKKTNQASVIGKVDNFFRMCEMILEEVKMDQELISMHKSRLGEDCYADEALHLLTMDIVYYGSKYMSEDDFKKRPVTKTETTYWPSLEEYDPGITTDVGLNTILYGPPGTGKTYHTVIYAVAIIENKELAAVEAEDYAEVLERYNEYKAQGRIEFTTFHQSYGYEEFIEGIKPVITEKSNGQIQYRVEAGVFKRFCELASNEGSAFDEAWSNLVKAAKQEENKYTFTRRTGSELTAQLRDDDSFVVKWTGGTQNILKKSKVLEQWNLKDYAHRETLSGGTKWEFDAIQAIIDTLTQKFSLKPANTIAERQNYVFIIDEINRGNISKIFGELITLIDPTKRIGMSEGMKAGLPYSQKTFGVPKNVYIIGTMNTADRSIATIDTALRRRFLFREMLPDPKILSDISVEDLSISDLLTRLNKRIAVLYDREHTIGHAYFMPLKASPTIDTLAEIFTNNIIPLLQEYFYEDYEKIRLVLGDNRKSATEEQFIIAKENDYVELFGDADIGLDDGCSYEINYAAFKNIEAYRSI